MSETQRVWPDDKLVVVTCSQVWDSADPARLLSVNDNNTYPATASPFQCATALNHYAERDYEVVAHSLVHERPGWFDFSAPLATPYFIGTWTMAKRKPVQEVHVAGGTIRTHTW